VRYVVLHAPSWQPGHLAAALDTARVERREVRMPRDVAADERPTVLVLDPHNRSTFPLDVLRAFVDEGGAIVALGRDGEVDLPREMPAELLAGFVRHPAGTREFLVTIRSGFREAAARTETARARAEVATRSREIGELTRIGVALGTERDLKTLLDLILTQARRISASDAGSLYLVERTDAGPTRLRIRIAQTFSKPDAPFVEFTVPVDRTSLAGHAATTGEALIIDDAYFLPPDVEYSINRSFDERYGYHTKSMLVIPMKDHGEQIIGVLQLINRKRQFDAVLSTPDVVEQQVVPYSRRTVDLVTALAGQAAVAIENSRLYEDIERLFEGFVLAAVTSIEQRDPTTFGHSGRVAKMTVDLAEVVDRASHSVFHNITFTREQLREIRYAGLLHDFGKVGVREQVLVKAKKLYPHDLLLIKQRCAFLRRTAERDFWRQRAEFLEKHGRKGYEAFCADLAAAQAREVAELAAFVRLVEHANEPTVLPEERFGPLVSFMQREYDDIDGDRRPYLTADEARFLTIPQGSLDPAERFEIESHVNLTYRFLQQIPWTRELQQVPFIAYGHHEKLDGRGYPRGVMGDGIPIQTRMMTISDIYDALTAADRPYKAAVAPARALDIMSEEVGVGQLDAALFGLFVEAKVFDRPKSV
jgi:HD-GYP domain-containing protein (c-di-GMP phosphodiesterase class II)